MRLLDAEGHGTLTSTGRLGEIGMLDRVESQYISVPKMTTHPPMILMGYILSI